MSPLYKVKNPDSKKEPVPPGIYMQISLPAAASSSFCLIAEVEKETYLKETFRQRITDDSYVLHVCNFVCMSCSPVDV